MKRKTMERFLKRNEWELTRRKLIDRNDHSAVVRTANKYKMTMDLEDIYEELKGE